MLHHIEAYISSQQPTYQKHQANKAQMSHGNELQSIARNAMELHQANRITAQTCTYPLAICNIHGEMCMDRRVYSQMPCVSIPSRMFLVISVHSYPQLQTTA